MRPGPCSLCTECSGRSKLFKPLTRRRVRKMSPERLAVEPPEPPRAQATGQACAKALRSEGPEEGETASLAAPTQAAQGDTSQVCRAGGPPH